MHPQTISDTNLVKNKKYIFSISFEPSEADLWSFYNECLGTNMIVCVYIRGNKQQSGRLAEI